MGHNLEMWVTGNKEAGGSKVKVCLKRVMNKHA